MPVGLSVLFLSIFLCDDSRALSGCLLDEI